MIKKFEKFMNLTGSNRLLFIEAILFQLWIGFILKVVPFKMIPRLFSLPTHLRSSVSGPPSQVSNQISVEIRQAILTSSSLSPWKNKCLVQSLAARLMLNKRNIPSQLSLGLDLCENKKMIAHAWLKTGDFEVVEKWGNYIELYLF
jgi:hypothetical protein